ncbi:MAG: PQQ-dependent sugar dehydrogenase [Flavobacterium sp.]
MKRNLLLLLGILGFCGYAQTIALQQFTSTTFTQPTDLANAGDSRLFVAQQNGAVKIVNSDGTVNSTNFLNIASLISTGSERGLLGIAFHPQYASNGYFYVNYTNTAGSTVVARYTRSTTDANVADTSTAQILLTVTQPYTNHNGGCIRFGPDGYLYIGMGDGGSGGDPQNYAQNINSLLGKMLRINVNSGTPYSNPSDNAFPGAVAGADEIWAVGFRNPWKFSFDRLTGDMWVADVGQDAVEEINKIAVLTPAGKNFGWRCYEGNSAYNTAGCGTASNYTMPFAQYLQTFNNGCSVTGGVVYRGAAYPNLQGKYIFADYCNNRLAYVSDTGTITWGAVQSGNNFTTFGEDINGEVYVMGRTSGILFKITDSTAGTDDFGRNAFAVYPNPAAGIVNIKSNTSHTAAAVAVFDLSGKQVSSAELTPAEAHILPVSNLSSGLYVMNITDTNGAVHTQKLAVE